MTLALAQTVKGVTLVLGYLTGVDQSGAYLLPTATDGSIEISFRAQRTDKQTGAKGGGNISCDRKLVALLKLDDKGMVA